MRGRDDECDGEGTGARIIIKKGSIVGFICVKEG